MAKLTVAKYQNTLAYKHFSNKYKNLAINVFKYGGLPPTIDELFIEKALYEDGFCLVFKDPHLVDINCLPCTPSRSLDIHGYPMYYRAVGHGYNEEYSILPEAKQAVLITNNKLRTPTVDAVHVYVSKIVNLMRTEDVNVETCKLPFIISADPDTKLTLLNILTDISANEPAIVTDKKLQLNDVIKVFDTKAKFIGGELFETRMNIENELLTFLGVNNVPVRKAERLITAEAESNNQVISDNVQIMLEARQKGVDAINKMFGTSITVEIRNKQKDDGEGEEKDVRN